MPVSLCCLAMLAAAPLAPQTPLERYTRTPDPAFAWEKSTPLDTPNVTIHNLKLTSQVWQSIRWTHGVQLFVPKNRPASPTAILWNQGGNPEPGATFLGTLLAEQVGVPVVYLFGVPNQPLFGGKREDALIAETFVRYLETGDSTWPLLFPMVKSVLAAMTASQQFGAEIGLDLQQFIVTGASKRGWTAWLSAASGDPRVRAIVPMVIDTLNMPAQIPHQLRSFGQPSAEIQDYTKRGLVPIPETGRAEELWRMVDPYQYRDRLTVPKLIVNGANDPYWASDATSLYWEALPGSKSLLMVPNAGHNLQEVVDAAGRTSRERIIQTLVAFCKSQAFGTAWPTPSGSVVPTATGFQLTVQGGMNASGVEFWRATAPTRDFRKARWERAESGPMTGTESRSFSVARPETGHAAAFALIEYRIANQTFQIGTPVRITDAKP